MILAAVRAEWFKLLRRRAVWVTIGLQLALAVGIGYLVTYLVATHPPAGAAQTASALAAARTGLYPASLVKKYLASASTLDGIFALILGVLVQGSEYAWGTVKTVQSQLPGRLSIVAGQLTALALLTLSMALCLLAADAAASYVVGLADGQGGSWPAVLDVLKGAGSAWLIFSMLAVVGFGLATMFRQSAMAMGLGLAYVLVIENLLFSLLVSLGDTWKQVQEWFPMANANYLVESFGRVRGAVTVSAAGPQVSAAHAVVVLALWIAAIAVVSGGLVRARDVA